MLFPPLLQVFTDDWHKLQTLSTTVHLLAESEKSCTERKRQESLLERHRFTLEFARRARKDGNVVLARRLLVGLGSAGGL